MTINDRKLGKYNANGKENILQMCIAKIIEQVLQRMMASIEQHWIMLDKSLQKLHEIYKGRIWKEGDDRASQEEKE